MIKVLKSIRNKLTARQPLSGFASIKTKEWSELGGYVAQSQSSVPPLTGGANGDHNDNSGLAVQESVEHDYHKLYQQHNDESNDAFVHHEALNKKYHRTNKKLVHGSSSYARYFHGHMDHSAIMRYTSWSRPFNERLLKQRNTFNHTPDFSHAGEIIDKHKNALARDHKEIASQTSHPQNKLTRSTILHSGIHPRFGEQIAALKHGEHVHLPAYTSTSRKRNTAIGFADARSASFGGDVHVLHFHLPKGYHHARSISDISHTPHEQEVLLHHGTTWKKVGHHITGTGSNPWGTSIQHHHLVPA